MVCIWSYPITQKYTEEIEMTLSLISFLDWNNFHYFPDKMFWSLSFYVLDLIESMNLQKRIHPCNRWEIIEEKNFKKKSIHKHRSKFKKKVRHHALDQEKRQVLLFHTNFLLFFFYKFPPQLSWRQLEASSGDQSLILHEIFSST